MFRLHYFTEINGNENLIINGYSLEEAHVMSNTLTLETFVSREFIGNGNVLEDEKAIGATISFHNISYALHDKSHMWSQIPLCKATLKKQILFDVSGTFKPGMNAILGKYSSFSFQ
jgi:hypothetical protein